MLIQSLLLIFVLFGIAALSIDLGLARLTQLQMQNATDSAALEGLRQRDSLTDEERRNSAVQFAAASVPEGVGPQVALEGGVTDFNALQTIRPQAVPSALAPNVANAVNGDMVSGEYNGTLPTTENDNFERNDFTAGCATEPCDAFLVRMRRTNDTNALDVPDGTSVSSGGAVPLLFGQVSTVSGDKRLKGVNIRATSIAVARPVRSVGANDVTGFALSRLAWDFETTSTVTLGTNGAVYRTPALASLGQPLDAGPQGLIDTAKHYVPIYEPDLGNRIIGFGYVEVSEPLIGTLTLTKRPSRIGLNASAIVSGGYAGIDTGTLAQIFAANINLEGALLAPSLAR